MADEVTAEQRRWCIAICVIATFGCASSTPPPKTEKKPAVETLHGVTITDPYRWLEDQNSPETRAWIDRENAYTDKVLGDRPEKDLFSTRAGQLLKGDQLYLSVPRNGRIFYVRRAAGEEVFSLYMREGAHGPDHLLIDPAPWNPKHTTHVTFDDITSDGKLVVYDVREGGADEVTPHFLDADSGREVGLPLPLGLYFGVSVTPDHRTVYYSKELPEGTRLFRRSIDGGAEEKVFGDGYSPDKKVSFGISDDGRWLAAVVDNGAARVRREIFLKDLTAPDSPFKTVVDDLDVTTGIDFAGDTLVLTTLWNAPNVRIMTVSAANPERANWREIVPENKSLPIQAMTLAGGRIYVQYVENLKPRFVAYDLQGNKVDELTFDTLGTTDGLTGSWNSSQTYYTFSSFAVPPTI
ncbi:MAG TPA: hypothetical protein VGJ82_00700 [Thermoanaerobaculia bacterium]